MYAAVAEFAPGRRKGKGTSALSMKSLITPFGKGKAVAEFAQGLCFAKAFGLHILGVIHCKDGAPQSRVRAMG